MTIMANDLKIRGVKILDEALKLEDEAIISALSSDQLNCAEIYKKNYQL